MKFKWGINQDCPDLLFEYSGHMGTENEHLGLCLMGGGVWSGNWNTRYFYHRTEKPMGDDYVL